MKPHIHAKSSIKNFGGKLEDYLEFCESVVVFEDSGKKQVYTVSMNKLN